jgi:hypothetical protein
MNDLQPTNNSKHGKMNCQNIRSLWIANIKQRLMPWRFPDPSSLSLLFSAAVADSYLPGYEPTALQYLLA